MRSYFSCSILQSLRLQRMNKMGQYNDKNQYQPWQGNTWKQLIISAVQTNSFLVAESTVERKLSNFKEK